MSIYAVVLAAGSGTRFGADKVMLMLRGKPLWRYSFDSFLQHPEIAGVGLVVKSEHLNSMADQAPQALFVASGGATRAESCAQAIDALPEDAEIVLIHDAARPLVSQDVITRVIEGVRKNMAAAPTISVTDTLRSVSESGSQALDRNSLRAMQTPQGITVDLAKKAFARPGWESAPDELWLAEREGVTPNLVEGSPRAMKLTHPDDLNLIAAYLGAPETRTGLGYDIHAFSDDPSRKLWLGGVHFPDHPALDGHSDADVVLHAAVDSILGALALGDIGQHFPNTDPQWKDRPSLDFLRFACDSLHQHGWKLRNMDITVIAESPKIGSRTVEMRQVMANALGVAIDRISMKATTNERLGAIGRSEGIAAFATAHIVQDP